MAKNKLAEVQANFIKSIEEKGIEHALTWVGGIYRSVAEELLKKEMEEQLGDRYSIPEARCLYLEAYLADVASRVSNRSTSVGHELMKDAFTSVAAKQFNELSRGQREVRWAALEKSLSEAKPGA